MTPEGRAAGVVRQVFGWRQVTDVAPITEAARRVDLVERVHHGARHADDFLVTVVALWPDGIPTFAEAEHHSHEQLDAIANVLGLAEAEFGVPF